MPIIKATDMTTSEPFPGVTSLSLVTKERGSERLTVLRMTISPGERIPLHYHPDHEEGIYLLEGTLQATHGDQEQAIVAGDVVLASPGTRHGLANLSEEPAVIMAIFPTSEVTRVLL